MITKQTKERLEDINAFERYLTRNGVVIRKFFLMSPEKNREKFLSRLTEKDKNLKFSSPMRKRNCWKDYMHAYEDMIQNTATKHSPWFVVPANNKWFTRLVVAGAVIAAMDELDLAYPKVDDEKRKELMAAKAELESQK